MYAQNLSFHERHRDKITGILGDQMLTNLQRTELLHVGYLREHGSDKKEFITKYLILCMEYQWISDFLGEPRRILYAAWGNCRYLLGLYEQGVEVRQSIELWILLFIIVTGRKPTYWKCGKTGYPHLFQLISLANTSSSVVHILGMLLAGTCGKIPG